MDKIVLIVAGGSGKRMGSEVPKQFLVLGGIPVLMHSLITFEKYCQNIRQILILPENHIDTWNHLCDQYHFKIKHEIKTGGATRFHSVKKNLADIPDNSLVAIHDGVRPLVSPETISRCFDTAAELGNAIPCVEIPETLRFIDKNGTRQVDRTQYRLIQTPQVFDGVILKKAYGQDFKESFTDDAGVVESMGYTIHLVQGNPENIKITFENDLRIAGSFIR